MNDDQKALSLARTDELAGEINQIKEQVRATVVKGAVEIGKRLKEAKSLVPYGQWEKWLETNVDYSARTAQNMMRIAEEYGKQETQALADLSITQAVLLLGVPAMEREAFISENDVESMSTRELQAAIDALKAEKEKMQLTMDELMRENEMLTRDTCYQADETAQAEEAGEELRRRIKKLEEEGKERDQEFEILENELSGEKIRGIELEDDLKREKAAKESAEAEKVIAAGKAAKLEKEKMEAMWREERAQAKAREAEDNAKQLADKLKTAEEALKRAQETVKTVEIVPEAVEQELSRLRRQASQTGAESEMRAAYDGFKAAFDRLMDKLDAAEKQDGKTAKAFKGAFCKAIMSMAKRLEE